MPFDQKETTAIPLIDSLQPEKQNSHEKSNDMPISPTLSSKASAQTVSTTTYKLREQEASSALNQHIEKLCQNLYPSSISLKHHFSLSRAATYLRTNKFLRSLVPRPQIRLIQHLKGGSFNHTTSITLPSSYSKGHGEFILRVPREEGPRPEQQVATLNYIRQRTSIPVATIEGSDFTCDNAVARPFVLQHWIPGRDLELVWDSLSHSQRSIIAEEVGRLIKTLLSVESSFVGTIEASTNGSHTSAELPIIVPFTLRNGLGDLIGEMEPDSTIGASDPCKTTLEFFEHCFSRWKKSALAENHGGFDRDVILYDNMLKVVREMNSLGLFKPDLNCLCHLDLHPRNIMVDIDSDDHIRITSILDWDEAVFAPKLVNCQPPGWLWGYDEDTHTENSLLPWPYELEGANDIPSTVEQQELKRIFEDCAGLEYPRLAYDHSARLVRGLYRLATLGLGASWDFRAGERIVKEWNLLRPGLAYRF